MATNDHPISRITRDTPLVVRTAPGSNSTTSWRSTINISGKPMGPTEDAVEGTANPPIPLPVEESRAKRLQRQQARFRDRGGFVLPVVDCEWCYRLTLFDSIFVPSSRNTLIDILLGRKVPSPQKRRSRSLSCSPVKSKPNGFPVGGRRSTKSPALSSRRMSPRKLNKREANEEEVVQPIAGMWQID